MYLAIVSTILDDVPIRLTHTPTAARRVLETCTRAQLDHVLGMLNRDGTEVCCGAVVRFGDGGMPIELVETVELPQFTDDGNDDGN